MRVDHWTQQQPTTAWPPVTLRDGAKGPLRVDILHQRVWLWGGEEAQAQPWHLLVRREIDHPTEIKDSLSNAAADMPTPRLAFMQGQRYWIERALQQGKQDVPRLRRSSARGRRATANGRRRSIPPTANSRLVNSDRCPDKVELIILE